MYSEIDVIKNSTRSQSRLDRDERGKRAAKKKERVKKSKRASSASSSQVPEGLSRFATAESLALSRCQSRSSDKVIRHKDTEPAPLRLSHSRLAAALPPWNH